ncbi:MAG: 4Fe-4S binding protein [Deltaproteobacteria bacterium]|nr:4Fe-4S binding protein [Deltaproteobacteria bacterium]
MSLRRTVQLISLALFLFFLVAAGTSIGPFLPVDSFLRLDPLIFTGTLISSRSFSFIFIPAILILLLGPVIGRFFCGYICPMGTTLDGTDKIIGTSRNTYSHLGKLRPIKYYLLVFIFGAAILGVSFVFIASPLSLITRFYGLVIYPVFAFLADAGIGFVQFVTDKIGYTNPIFAQIKTPRFSTQFFILIFFIVLFISVRLSPRFWCRYLCPAGALMALISRKPLIRRLVTEDCTDCEKCVKSCPMGAILDDPRSTYHEECIACQTCETVCPVSAISFTSKVSGLPLAVDEFSPTRRHFIASGLAGAGVAAVCITGLDSVYSQAGTGQVSDPSLIRPPGALPEKEFLTKCVRCGECMAACPTNTLQPLWFESGIMGLFSPGLVMRRGPCDPECTRCGEVCPAEAIRSLSKSERVWAKIGTAVISRQYCLAWEHQKKCLVCDEVCPFDAVAFKHEPGNPVSVPHVIEDKCSGCGFCEHFCPVQNQAAIFITPMGELRQAKGSYKEQGKRQGLKLSLTSRITYGQPALEEESRSGPAPGFTE